MHGVAEAGDRAPRGGVLWPTLAMLVALALLIGLGTWQVQRLHWKEGLIARIEARAHAEPVTIEQALRLASQTGDVEYLRVRLNGRFRHADEMHLYAISEAGAPGWRIITPFVTVSGPIVLVDRGFVPLALKEPATRMAGQVEGVQTVVGLARAAEKQGLFTPDNDAVKNVWYWRDLGAMSRVAVGEADRGRVAPFFVEAEAAAIPGGWPKGGATRLDLPNRHLEYALTWYGLAVALLTVYVVFMFGRRVRGE